MFCTKCGAQHPDGTNFCTQCGNKMRSIPAAAPEAVEIPVAQPVPEPVTEDICEATVVVKPEPVDAPAAEVFEEDDATVVIKPEPEVAPAAEAVEEECEATAVAEPEPVPEAVSEAAPEEAPAQPGAPEPAPEEAPVQVPEQTAAPKACVKCGAAMEADSMICPSCGTYQEEAAPEKKKGSKKLVLIIVAAVLALALLVVGGYFLINELGYQSAMTLIEEGDYPAAIEKLDGLKNYRDSADLADDLRADAVTYEEATVLLESGDLDGAAKLLKKLDDYSDAEELLTNITAYQDAAALMDVCDYEGAKEAFAALGDFYDSADMAAYGVDYACALYMMECAAKEDLAGSDLIPDAVPLDPDSPLTSRANMYLDAAAVLQGMEYSDAADQANECLYQASVLLMEADDFEGALALREQMDDATAQRFDASYQSYCVDSTLWDEIKASTELVPSDADNADYKAGLEEQVAYLDTILDGHFANEDLKALVESYKASLESELALMDAEGVITDWVSGYQSFAQQFTVLADITEALEVGEAAVTFCTDSANLYAVQAELEAILYSQLNADAKTDGSGEYSNYLTIENTSEYGFSIIYAIDWFDGETLVSTDEAKTVEVAAGASVEIPLILPDGLSEATYIIYWETFDISQNGTLLPGQE